MALYEQICKQKSTKKVPVDIKKMNYHIAIEESAPMKEKGCYHIHFFIKFPSKMEYRDKRGIEQLTLIRPELARCNATSVWTERSIESLIIFKRIMAKFISKFR